jgi:hypothetical protein
VVAHQLAKASFEHVLDGSGFDAEGVVVGDEESSVWWCLDLVVSAASG